MADLTSILGGPWSPPPEKIVAPPEEQLLQAMLAAGLARPDKPIEIDGKVHRFNSGTKGKPGHDKSGWYVAFPGVVPAGRFGCWRIGIDCTWKADIGRKLSAAEEMGHLRRMTEAKAIRDQELERQRQITSETVEVIWSNAHAASPDHPYLLRKGIQPHGARVTGDGRLVVPLFDEDGQLCTLQYIDNDKGKLYHQGGQSGGKFWMVGSMDEPGCCTLQKVLQLPPLSTKPQTDPVWWPTAPAA